MISGKKYICSHPFFFLRKHYCPDCGAKMNVTKASKIVNSNSPEAKNYDFSSGDTFLVGDVEFIFKVFECPDCKICLTVDEMKKHECTAVK